MPSGKDEEEAACKEQKRLQNPKDSAWKTYAKLLESHPSLNDPGDLK